MYIGTGYIVSCDEFSMRLFDGIKKSLGFFRAAKMYQITVFLNKIGLNKEHILESSNEWSIGRLNSRHFSKSIQKQQFQRAGASEIVFRQNYHETHQQNVSNFPGIKKVPQVI